MKKIIVVIMFLGFMIATPIQSEAVIFPDYTDVNAVRIQDGYFPDEGLNLNPRGENTNFDQDGGTAFKFIVKQPLEINSLVVDLRTTTGGESSDDETINFLFNIYSGSKEFRDSGLPVPDVTSLEISSAGQIGKKVIPVPGHPQGFVYDDHTIDDYSLPFKIKLLPGEYWLAAEKQARGQLGYSNVRFDGVVTPEPSTMLLFGSGLLGAFIKRRKRI